MIFLNFKNQNEVFKFRIDRKNKKLEVACRKTNYRFQPMPWRYLFDKGKEEEQEKITDPLDDETFKTTVIEQMKGLGYIKYGV